MGGGCRWKSQNRKSVPLSPYIEKPLNSKVIKSFVPELRSRKSFSCFEIPMFYVIYIWTLYVHFAYPYHGYGTPKPPENTSKILIFNSFFKISASLVKPLISGQNKLIELFHNLNCSTQSIPIKLFVFLITKSFNFNVFSFNVSYLINSPPNFIFNPGKY